MLYRNTKFISIIYFIINKIVNAKNTLKFSIKDEQMRLLTQKNR